MPLQADTPADRADQLCALTERLTVLLDAETKLIQAQQPPLGGEEGEEKARLANLYRQEMSRIAADRGLIRSAPAPTLARLRTLTERFRTALSTHERALLGVKQVSEGLVKAIAEEVARVRGGGAGYGASGGYAQSGSAGAALAVRKTA
jgi:hypothetical protein